MRIFKATKSGVSGMYQKVMSNSNTRILAIITLSLFFASTFVLVYSYYTQIEQYKVAELSRLQCISRSCAAQIDGDAHQRLNQRFKEKDQISNSSQDSDYLLLHQQLKKMKEANDVESDIYTLVYDDINGHFEFIVTSGVNPYFRHRWLEYHPTNVNDYYTGSSFGPYQDEHGCWMSSFSPITDSNGNVVAIVQVDGDFDSFIAQARNEVAKYIFFVLSGFMLLMYFMSRSVRHILKKERILHDRILEQNAELSETKNEVRNSIHYAKNIQEAILPDYDTVGRSFPKSFVLFKPRDIVSGDFYWIHEDDGRKYIAVADCTGHGVPGAFMSLLGTSTLNKIMSERKGLGPAEILSSLDSELKKQLQREKSRDGMDISLICLDERKNRVSFSGANRPVLHMRNGISTIYKGDKRGIGSYSVNSINFSEHNLDIKTGDRLYMYSDGYADQFGGVKKKKYYSKRLIETIANSQDVCIEDQRYLFNYEFHLWKSNLDQVDDVLVAGIEV